MTSVTLEIQINFEKRPENIKKKKEQQQQQKTQLKTSLIFHDCRDEI